MTKSIDLIRKSLKKRYAKERRYKLLGMLSVSIAFSFLVLLLTDITVKAWPAFRQAVVSLPVELSADALDVTAQSDLEELRAADWMAPLRATLLERFPEVSSRSEKRKLFSMLSAGAEYQLQQAVMDNPNLIGTTVTLDYIAADDVDLVLKGLIDASLPEDERRVDDQQLGWIQSLQEAGNLSTRFNTTFFTSSDSREPELAGIRGALSGTFLTLLVTLMLSFPIGVAAATYLEEFAPRNNRWIDFIEININNLAAVPSIVFGLLGLAVFINFFSMPRSAPLVGGIVLSLMTLPTIIIASRSAIKAVPPSLREAVLGLGASRMQMVFHHVLPTAMPGILTGTIIGMAQALGETAPLLMIGMVAFIVDVPTGMTDPATVLPVQIFLWADSPERGFVAKTSAAILVLISFLILMNALAIYLRNRFEKR